MPRRHASRKALPTAALVLAFALTTLPPAHATSCADAAAAAERQAGLPEGLLAAIGKVESGRPDPRSGAVQPWPWTVNAGGEGRYFDNADEATAWVAAERARGVSSIDIGCFQVSLKYHPSAFATVAEGFDPVANAQYAARFLIELNQRTGNWPDAVAAYHSADAARGIPYRALVMARLGGQPAMPRQATAQILATQPDPYVISIAAALGGPRGGLAPRAAASPGLPRIIVPAAFRLRG